MQLRNFNFYCRISWFSNVVLNEKGEGGKEGNERRSEGGKKGEVRQEKKEGMGKNKSGKMREGERGEVSEGGRKGGSEGGRKGGEERENDREERKSCFHPFIFQHVCSSISVSFSCLNWPSMTTIWSHILVSSFSALWIQTLIKYLFSVLFFFIKILLNFISENFKKTLNAACKNSLIIFWQFRYLSCLDKM